MPDRPYKALFLCTGNSARSILAESLLNHLGQRRFIAFSAGSFPKGEVHPLALQLLTEQGLPTIALRSKSWSEFAKPGAPAMDFIFTVCDQAAGEMCPIWPGQPITAHWGLPDPATVQDDGAGAPMRAFRDTLRSLEHRIKPFLALPIAALDSVARQRQADAIGRIRSDAAEDPAA